MVLIYHSLKFKSLKTFYNFSFVWTRTKTKSAKSFCATDYTTKDSARLESNQRPHDPKSRILPSELLAGIMGRCGFEPQTFRIWAGCSNQLSYLPKFDVSYESRTHNPYGNCFWGSRVYQFRQRNIIWFRRESNLHTIWQLILSQPCLPLHHAGMYYSEPDLHRQAISATGLKPVVFPNFTIKA